MKVAYFTRLTDTAPETGRQISSHISNQLGNRPPDGAIFHTEGPTDDGGWWAFNVWESDEAARLFSDEVLRPTLQRYNVSATVTQRLSAAWDSNHPDSRRR